MAARIDRIHSERVRARIRVGLLQKALEDNVLGRVVRRDSKKQKERDFLSANQIKCAQTLLAKVMPDIQRTELTGKDGKDLPVVLQAQPGDGDL